MSILNNIAAGLVVLGIFGIWWFLKKHPNPKYMLASVLLTIVAFIAFGISFDLAKKDNEQLSPATTSKSLETPENSTADTFISEEETPETDISDSSEDKPKQLDDEGAQKFVEYFQQKLDETYAPEGYTMQVSGTDRTIDVIVPQEFKYQHGSSLQELADSLMTAKDSHFKNWASENGYDYTQVSPWLYVKAEDNTTLAAQKAFKGMVLKVNNN